MKTNSPLMRFAILIVLVIAVVGIVAEMVGAR
jgi:hypothetical protein